MSIGTVSNGSYRQQEVLPTNNTAIGDNPKSGQAGRLIRFIAGLDNCRTSMPARGRFAPAPRTNCSPDSGRHAGNFGADGDLGGRGTVGAALPRCSVRFGWSCRRFVGDGAGPERNSEPGADPGGEHRVSSTAEAASPRRVASWQCRGIREERKSRPNAAPVLLTG